MRVAPGDCSPRARRTANLPARIPSARPPVHDSKKLEQDLALLLKRAGQRAQRAGALGCGSVMALAFVLSPLDVLNSRGGWIFLVVAFFVILAIAGRRATRASTEEFQALYRAERGNPERRDAAVAYLWKRAHPTHRNAKSDKAARDILNRLGVTIDPATLPERDDALATRRLEPEALVAPVEVSVPPPPPRVAAPAHETPRAPAAPPPRPVRPDVHGTPTVTSHTQTHDAPTPTAVPSHSSATPYPTAWRKPDAAPRPIPAAPPPPAPAAVSVTPPAPPSAPAPSAAPNTPAPAVPLSRPAPSAGSVSPARTLRCDYCGTVRTLAHGEPLTSCPVCFPRIQLDT